MQWRTWALALLIIGTLTCAPADKPRDSLMVFAASSLTEALQEVGQVFQEDDEDFAIRFNFAGSSVLATQLLHGASADLFASADPFQIDRVRDAGLLDSAPVPFASNELVVVTPHSGPVVATLQDLAKPGVKLVLALKSVPAGAYARQALSNMARSQEFGASFSQRALGNLVSEETNVRQALAKVVLGEADAAIVYRTDITTDVAGRVRVILIPQQYNIEAIYWIGVLSQTSHPAEARAFIEAFLSERGRAILRSYGFRRPPP